MIWRAIVIAGLLLGACQSEDYERVAYPAQAVSIRKLPGWRARDERGAVVFSQPGSRVTISIRGAALDRRFAQTIEALAGATKQVLQSLDQAEVRGPLTFEHSELSAVLFELSFVPPGSRSRYERRHVSLLGKEHLYHAVLTAPAGEAEPHLRTFKQVVGSMREE